MGTFTPLNRPPRFTLDQFSDDAQIVLKSMQQKFEHGAFQHVVILTSDTNDLRIPSSITSTSTESSDSALRHSNVPSHWLEESAVSVNRKRNSLVVPGNSGNSNPTPLSSNSKRFRLASGAENSRREREHYFPTIQGHEKRSGTDYDSENIVVRTSGAVSPHQLVEVSTNYLMNNSESPPMELEPLQSLKSHSSPPYSQSQSDGPVRPLPDFRQGFIETNEKKPGESHVGESCSPRVDARLAPVILSSNTFGSYATDDDNNVQMSLAPEPPSLDTSELKESRLAIRLLEIRQSKKCPVFKCPIKPTTESRTAKTRPVPRTVADKNVSSIDPANDGTARGMRKQDREQQWSEEPILKTPERKPSTLVSPATPNQGNRPALDISRLGSSDLENVRDTMERAKEIGLTLVYTDWTTQIRERIETRRPVLMRAHVSGLYCLCKTDQHQCQLYYVPLHETNNRDEEYRYVVSDMLSMATRKICYNAKDLIKAVITRFNLEPSAVVNKWMLLDPRLACWLLDPDHPPNSFIQCLQTVGLRADTDDGESVYNDLILQSSLMERLYHKLEETDMWELFFNLESRLTTVLSAMELRGLSIDTGKMLEFGDILKKNIQALETAAHQSLGRTFSLTSHVQLRQILFEELKLDEKLPAKAKLNRTSVQNEKSTSEAVLNQLVTLHPLPGIVLEHRQLSKFKSTYVDGLLMFVKSGLLFTHWDQLAASTGRLQSVQPNVQAIPKTPLVLNSQKTAGLEEDDVTILLREPFVPDSGYSFLVADFQQIEFRLLAHLSGDQELLSLFKDPDQDVFNNLTAQWLKKRVEDVTESEREQTKRIVYSVMYGVGKDRLSEYLQTTPQAAKVVMQNFLKCFPAISAFSKQCIETCKKQGYIESIFHRRRLSPNIHHASPVLRAQAERQAVNFRVQGSAADLCKAAMVQIEHALATRELDARTQIQIHDELVVEVNDTCLTEVADLVYSVMQSAEGLCGTMVKLEVPLRVSVSVGKSWGHLEPYHGEK